MTPSSLPGLWPGPSHRTTEGWAGSRPLLSLPATAPPGAGAPPAGLAPGGVRICHAFVFCFFVLSLECVCWRTCYLTWIPPASSSKKQTCSPSSPFLRPSLTACVLVSVFTRGAGATLRQRTLLRADGHQRLWETLHACGRGRGPGEKRQTPSLWRVMAQPAGSWPVLAARLNPARH